MFKPSLLYGLSTTDTIELTFISKIIVGVIDKGKVIALPQKNKVINIDTPGINLGVVNMWCSDFPAEVVNGVITSGGSDVWHRVSMTDCCCKVTGEVSAEFPSLTGCLVIEGIITAELELKTGEVECLKVSSPSSCIMIEGMLTAEFESKAGTVNDCEILSFSGWVMS